MSLSRSVFLTLSFSDLVVLVTYTVTTAIEKVVLPSSYMCLCPVASVNRTRTRVQL